LCQKVGIDYDHFNVNKGGTCGNKLWEGTGNHDAEVRAALENDDDLPDLIDEDDPRPVAAGPAIAVPPNNDHGVWRRMPIVEFNQ
jgi:hypothetical protein